MRGNFGILLGQGASSGIGRARLGEGQGGMRDGGQDLGGVRRGGSTHAQGGGH